MEAFSAALGDNSAVSSAKQASSPRKLWELNPMETLELLLSLGVPPTAAEALYRQDFNGKMFWEWDMEDYRRLVKEEPEGAGASLKTATIITILKARDLQKKMRPPDDILRMIQDGGAGAERHHSSVNISGGCGDNNRPLPLPLSSQGRLARLPTPPRTQMFSARDEDLTVVPPDSGDSVAVFNNQAKTETWETATPASLDFGQITRDHSWNNNSGGAGGTSNNESGDGSFSRFLGLFAGKQEENWWPAPPPCPTEEEILAPEKDIEEEGWFKEVLEAENKAKEADGRNSIALTPTPMNVQEELGENSGNAISPVQPLKNEEKDAGEAETKVESSTTQELSPTGTKPKKNKKGKRSRGEVVPMKEGVEGAPNDVSETKASTETRGTGGEQLLRDAKEEHDLQPRRGPIKLEKVRKFGQPVDSTLQYTSGNTVGTETGVSSYPEPAREFKEFDRTLMENKAATEEAFVKRVGIFAFGCLNARCNGVLYLGIGDSYKGKHHDGCIVGVQLTEEDKTLLQSLMDLHFVGPNPKSMKGVDAESRAAVQNCLRPLKFVPVSKGVITPNLYVVEVEVEPAAAVCKDIRFYMSVRKEMPKKKKHGNDTVSYDRTYFLREGAVTNSYKEKSQLAEFSLKVEAAIRRRDSDEKSTKVHGKGQPVERLWGLLCRGRSCYNLNDKDHKYVLLCNGLPDMEKASWIAKTNWYLMLDFSIEDNPCGNGDNDEPGDDDSSINLLAHFMDGKIREPSYFTGKDLTEFLGAENSQESVVEFLNELRIGERSLFIQCGSKRSSDTPKWFREVMKGLSVLLSHVLDAQRLGSIDNVVIMLAIGGDTRLQEISMTVRKMAEVVNPDQFVCMFEDRGKLALIDKEVEHVFGTEQWEKQKIPVSWPQLHKFLNDKTVKTIFSGYELLGSSGAMISVESEFLSLFKEEGLHVLPSNQCDDILSKSTEEKIKCCEDGKKKILEFLGGKEPEWAVFFYTNTSSAPIVQEMPPGVVKRDITAEIVKSLDELSKNDEKCVARLCISHYPGSGATTIGRSILWETRRKMRCLMLDGRNYKKGEEYNQAKLQGAADKILLLRAYSEQNEVVKGKSEEFSCPTVLILFDNCNDIMAQLLTSFLEKRVENKGITFKKTMFLLMYLKCSFNQDDTLRESQDSKKFFIKQELTDKERNTFNTRLGYLKKNHGFEPRDMLSFVIMAENFDKDSGYVRKLVGSALMDMREIYPQQRKVLLYLSILKYFGNAHLPVHHCKKLAFAFGDGTFKCKSDNPAAKELATMWRDFSPQVEMFISYSEGRETAHGNSYAANYEFMEISHVPLAYQLFLELRQGRTLVDIVREMMEEEVLMKRRYMKDLIHGTVRKLLVRRDVSGSFSLFSGTEVAEATTTHASNRPLERRQPFRENQRKQNFSNLIQYIFDTESREDASNLLEVGYEALSSNDDKAYIAQTMARMHYTDKKEIGKATKWAERASELAPDKFAIIDTEGQVYKRHLKFLIDDQKARSDSGYYMRECAAVLRAGSLASRHFRKAQNLFVAMKKKFRQDGKVYDKTVTDQDAYSSDNPGLFGEIETNLLVARHILGTRDLEQGEKKETFLQFLRKEKEGLDLPSLFRDDVTWPWAEYYDFISDLLSRTAECLQNVTRKLTYTHANHLWLQSNRWKMEMLEGFTKEFGDMFGVKAGGDWRKLAGKSGKSSKEKMSFLRKHLSAGITNSFGWIKLRQPDILRDHREHLAAMAELACKDAPMWTEDKISYANVFFAFVYNRKAEECRQLKVELIKHFCRQLVQDEVDFPEPYFFFLMLFWPPMVAEQQHERQRYGRGGGGASVRNVLRYQSVDSEVLDLLRRCIVRLQEFEEQFTDAQVKAGLYISSKPVPIFYLRESRGGSEAVPVASSLRSNWTQWSDGCRVCGTLDNRKDAVISFAPDRRGLGIATRCGGEQRLTIRAATHFTRGKKWARDVNFVLGFTFSGPVAYGIKQENVEDRNLEMLGMPPGAGDEGEGEGAEDKDVGEEA